MPTIERIFTPGWHAGFTVLFKDAPFVEQAVRYCGLGRDGHRFDFFWQTLMDRVGGGPPVSAAATLTTDRCGRPLAYTIYSDRSSVRSIGFEDDVAHVELSDGSTQVIALAARPDLVFQRNVIVQLGLFAVLCPPRGEAPLCAQFFSPESLAVHELKLTRSPEDRIVTSLGFDFAMTAQNVREMRSLSRPAAIMGRAAEIKIPVADFQEYRHCSGVTYVAPENLPILVQEVDVSGLEQTLGGALSCPSRGQAPFPSFLYLQGSGAIDRHGMSCSVNLGSSALCDALSAAGFAGLRIDARGAGRTGFGNLNTRLFASRCADALTAIDWFLKRPEVDPSRFFLIGHSLGALVALAVLRARPELTVAGLILMAMPGRSMGRVLASQTKREGQRIEIDPPEMALRRKALADWLRRVRNGKALQTPAQALSSSFAALADQDVFAIKPRRLLVEAGRPVLLCQGGKDIQISLKDDALPLIQAASSATIDAELRVYCNLDHLFRYEARSPAPSSYFELRPIDSRFIDSVTAWLQSRATGP